MPAFNDLTGQKIGKLTVLKLVEKGQRYHFWLCECECGTVETIHSKHFERVAACTACRKPPCVICGGKIPVERGMKNTCSEQCESLKLKTIGNRHYAKRIVLDPDMHKKRHDKDRERRKSDPVYDSQRRAFERERHQIRKHDPAYQQYKHEYAQRYWDANKAAIAEARKLRLRSLSLEQREELRADAVNRTAKYKRAWLTDLKKDPVAYEQYRTDRRAKNAERMRQKALIALSQDFSKMQGNQS